MTKRTTLDPDQRAEVVQDIIRVVMEQLGPRIDSVVKLIVESFAITEPQLKEHVIYMVNEAIALKLHEQGHNNQGESK